MKGPRLHLLLTDPEGTQTTGSVVSQALHATHALQDADPAAYTRWHTTSNTLVILRASPEELEQLRQKADVLGVPHAVFREPDPPWNDSPSALAIYPEADTELQLVKYATRRLRPL